MQSLYILSLKQDSCQTCQLRNLFHHCIWTSGGQLQRSFWQCPYLGLPGLHRRCVSVISPLNDSHLYNRMCISITVIQSDVETHYQRRRRHFKSGQVTTNKRSLVHVEGVGGLQQAMCSSKRLKTTCGIKMRKCWCSPVGPYTPGKGELAWDTWPNRLVLRWSLHPENKTTGDLLKSGPALAGPAGPAMPPLIIHRFILSESTAWYVTVQSYLSGLNPLHGPKSHVLH